MLPCVLAAALSACSGSPEASPASSNALHRTSPSSSALHRTSPASTEYPLDDTLRLNQLQAKGTHNSYHIETIPIPDWQYTHAPLDEQLTDEGVRHFELDLHYKPDPPHFEVYHLPLIDMGTTCRQLEDCLQTLKDWSDANQDYHHPLMIMFEPKDPFDKISPEAWSDLIDEQLLAVWPEDRIITPDMVQGSYPDLPTALGYAGWPTLGEVRGMIMFVLMDDEQYRDAYTYDSTSLAGRVMFVTADIGEPYSAFLMLNDPIADFTAIQSAVSSGYLVRTRADSGGDEAQNNDTTQRDAALASGAQFVTTDFPVPTSDTEYWVDIPGGTPSRCNPVSAPAVCTSEDIENPALVDATGSTGENRYREGW